eukprot:scaffold10021_cov147-Isochrysis_galbana.AAC.1
MVLWPRSHPPALRSEALLPLRGAAGAAPRPARPRPPCPHPHTTEGRRWVGNASSGVSMGLSLTHWTPRPICGKPLPCTIARSPCPHPGAVGAWARLRPEGAHANLSPTARVETAPHRFKYQMYSETAEERSEHQPGVIARGCEGRVGPAAQYEEGSGWRAEQERRQRGLEHQHSGASTMRVRHKHCRILLRESRCMWIARGLLAARQRIAAPQGLLTARCRLVAQILLTAQGRAVRSHAQLGRPCCDASPGVERPSRMRTRRRERPAGQGFTPGKGAFSGGGGWQAMGGVSGRPQTSHARLSVVRMICPPPSSTEPSINSSPAIVL